MIKFFDSNVGVIDWIQYMIGLWLVVPVYDWSVHGSTRVFRITEFHLLVYSRLYVNRIESNGTEKIIRITRCCHWEHDKYVSAFLLLWSIIQRVEN